MLNSVQYWLFPPCFKISPILRSWGVIAVVLVTTLNLRCFSMLNPCLALGLYPHTFPSFPPHLSPTCDHVVFVSSYSIPLTAGGHLSRSHTQISSITIICHWAQVSYEVSIFFSFLSPGSRKPWFSVVCGCSSRKLREGRLSHSWPWILEDDFANKLCFLVWLFCLPSPNYMFMGIGGPLHVSVTWRFGARWKQGFEGLWRCLFQVL